MTAAALPAPAPDPGWRFERTISPGVLLTAATIFAGILLQMWVASGWISAQTARLDEHDRAIARLITQVAEGDKRILERGDERFRNVSGRLDLLEAGRVTADVRVTRLEERFAWVQDALARIERKLDAAKPERR